MIVVASTIEPIIYAAEEERDLDAEAALTGFYVMSIILVLMFLAKFCFDVLFIYGVSTVSVLVLTATSLGFMVFSRAN